MITFTKERKVPLRAGSYKAIINNIQEFQYNAGKNKPSSLVYDLSVFTGDEIIDVPIRVFTNGKDFDDFSYKVANNYCPDDPKGVTSPEKHIGTVVQAEISVYFKEEGSQYLRLDSYAPYSEGGGH